MGISELKPAPQWRMTGQFSNGPQHGKVKGWVREATVSVFVHCSSASGHIANHVFHLTCSGLKAPVPNGVVRFRKSRFNRTEKAAQRSALNVQYYSGADHTTSSQCGKALTTIYQIMTHTHAYCTHTGKHTHTHTTIRISAHPALSHGSVLKLTFSAFHHRKISPSKNNKAARHIN